MLNFCAELQALIDAAEYHASPYRSHEDAWEAALDRARAALAAKPQGQGPTIDDVYDLCEEHDFSLDDSQNIECSAECLLSIITDALARWGRPAPPPEPCSIPENVRFQFFIYDENLEQQASGEAPSYKEALQEGYHYLKQFSEDGPCNLELARVEILFKTTDTTDD